MAAVARVGRPARCDVTVDGGYEAQWIDDAGAKFTERFPKETQAVQHVARNQAGGLRFHDLRHSYATWLVDDGVPPNMVQRVMGHERSSTTFGLYTRRTDNSDRILDALNDPDDEPGERTRSMTGLRREGAAPRMLREPGGSPVAGDPDTTKAPCSCWSGGLSWVVGDTGIEPVTSSVSMRKPLLGR
jgi:hypothetical protein